MSCVSQQSQPFRFVVSMGQLPEGFCGTQQELAQAIADRLLIQSDQNFSSFAIGPDAPTSNVGPWLKDCTTWYVWDDSTGAYIPMPFPALAVVTCGMIQMWSGAIADIPAGYLLCDGGEYLAQNYPCLYGVIGTSYGVGGCAGSFLVPDLRNRFVVGADADVGNVAESTITGAPLKTGGATTAPHSHTVTWNPDLNPGGTGASMEAKLASTLPCSTESPSIIPPFMALAFIIKT